jgi:hypothetical protein
VIERLSLGRVHVLGDAAHQFPPAGAFGANTGLQDAHNLCWKLAAVHHGHGSSALLRTYDSDRRPVALANARLAVHNYHRGLRVAHALGLPSELPHAMAAMIGELRAAAPSAAASVAASAAASVAAASSSSFSAAASSSAASSASASVSAASSSSSAAAAEPKAAALAFGLIASGLHAGAGALHAVLHAAGAPAAAELLQRPPGGPRGLGDRVLELGRMRLIESLGHEAHNPLGRQRRESARQVVATGQALPLLFARHELGFVYETQASATREEVQSPNL